LGLSALVLLTTLGGNSYAWDSAFIVGLGVIAVTAIAAFVAVERRAAEPVLPPQLFRNRVFSVTSGIGFVIGLAMFGALTYLPLFQQVVRGLTPTESGLQLLPLMAGLLVASIGSGQIITRTGRYKLFPIAGTAIAGVGMLLLSGLDADTTTVQAGLFMLVFGFGLGLVMQVLVLAVQNAVPYEQLGVATSAATLFRSIGGSLGTAILGAIFSNRLANELAGALPTGAAAERLAAGDANPAQLDRLPAPLRDAYIGAFTDALSSVFLIAAAIVAVAFLLTLLLEERPLRQTVETAGLGEAFAAPCGSDSLTELSRKLGRLVGRERTRRFIEGAAARAGVDLPPLECWLLVRIARDGPPDLAALADRTSLDESTLTGALANLSEHGLVVSGPEGTTLTPAGVETFGRLTEARDAALRELVADWEPEGDELDEVVAELAQELDVRV
ncbi:MAG TPA: MFS transporter, partial [Thermoleophilaceae bacterium]